MLNLSDELQPFLEQRFPLLRVHRYDGTRCTCGNPDCRWDAEKGGTAGKHPAERNGVHGAVLRDSAKVFKGLNAGVACGRGFVVLDIDPRNGGDKSLAQLIAANQPLPRTWQVASGGGGVHYYFKVDGEQRGGKRVDGVDLIGVGGYVLAPGSVHPSQKQYEWEIHPSECEIAPLPEWVKIACCGVPVERTIGQDVNLDSVYDEQDLRDALEFLDPNMAEPKWFEIGACIHSAGFPIEIWDEWSAKSNRYDAEVLREKWSRYDANKPGRKTIGSLFWEAKQAGWVPREIEKWDFQKLASEQAQKYAQAEPEPKVIAEREFPRGILGVVAQDIFDSALHKDRGFAIETVLLCVAVAAQKRYRTPLLGVVHQYSLLLTRSGGGKASYTNAAKKILERVSEHLLLGDCASGQALRMLMQICPTKAMIRDEGVETLISLLDEKDAHAKRLHADLLSMWSNGNLESISVKDLANASPEIKSPHMSFLFGGPIDSFERMLKNNTALSEKGLLSRMNIILGNKQKPKYGEFTVRRMFEPRKEFIDLLKQIAGMSVVSEIDQQKKTLVRVDIKPDVIEACWESENVRFVLEDFVYHCHEQAETYTHSGVYSRVGERALRTATLVAIAENSKKPVIDRELISWAIRDAEWILNPVKSKCEEHLGKSDESYTRDKIVNALKKQGGRCSRRKIAKWWPRWNSLDERIRQAAVDGLERDGIIAVTTSGANRNKGEQILALLSN